MRMDSIPMKTLALLLTTVFAFASPASAHHFDYLDEDHKYLLHSVSDRGVELIVNDAELCTGSSDGFYSSDRRLIICQDAMVEPGVEVEWSLNDLDTIRHESHHFLQDCAFGGSRIDHMSTVFFTDTEKYADFVLNSGLTQSEIDRIETAYRKLGLNFLGIMMEIEAFAVARSVPPRQLADKIKEVCVIGR